MVKAEINYNPYLRETQIKFNGQEPRINSLVEKYQSEYLQTWVKRIPKIFYDEMNGYDFELEFTGTKLDFEDVVDAFREAGVTEEQVHLFHKKEIADRIQKDAELDDLIKWMLDHKNTRFDAVELMKENSDLFDSSYPLIMMHGDDAEEINFGRIRVSGEVVNQVAELDKTDLTNTPIVFFLDRTTKGLLQGELRQLLNRSDVTEQQLFFMIHNALDFHKMERIIRDLGIKKPKTVQSLSDDQIEKYLKLYPISEYLYQALSLLQVKMDALYTELQEVNERANKANREIYEQINFYDAMLNNLKTASYNFRNRDNLDIPESWSGHKERLCTELATWKNRKTKFMGEAEAGTASEDLNRDAFRMYWTCITAMQTDAKAIINNMLEMFSDWYKKTTAEEAVDLSSIQDELEKAPISPDLKAGLLQLSTLEYVAEKPNFMGFFKASNTTEQSVRPVNAYYLHQWREYAVETVSQVVDQYAESYFNSLKGYLSKVADAYIQKIEELIDKYSEKKAETASQLSEEENLLQSDNDWVAKVRGQLNEIERG